MQRMLGFVLGAIPLAFGALRFAQTGTDWRYLITAAVSLAAAILAARTAHKRGPGTPALTFVVASIAATVTGAISAYTTGARHLGALLFVAAGFAICTGACAALLVRPAAR